MKRPDLRRTKLPIADMQRGAPKAHRGSMLDGEADGAGRGAKMARPLSEGYGSVAAEEEVPRRVEKVISHSVSFCRLRADRVQILARCSG